MIPLVILAALIAAGVVAAVILTRDDSSSSSVSVPQDCGAKIGETGQVANVAYVESNVANSNANTIIAIPYRAGDMQPLEMSACSTGGSGSADLTDSGVLDANSQVIVNRDHTFLFAVNQGSDTIAVFSIARNRGLKAVSGSPFPARGKAPASLGLSGDTLVVANKAQDGVRELSKVNPNYTTFHVGSDGRLTRVDGSDVQADPGSSPTDAFVPRSGGVAFSTEESGPLRGFSIGSDGVLAQASNSPLKIDDSIFAPGFNPAKEFALGVIDHPTRPILYISMPTVPALAVYSYDPTGKLSFERSVTNAGAYLPCWNVVTPDGKWLYTSNAATNNVTAFDIGSDPMQPRQIQTFAFDTPGNPWNATTDPDGKFLFVNTPRDTTAVPEGEGNTQHVLRIGSDGTLDELGSPIDLPVPADANPQGLAVIPGS